MSSLAALIGGGPGGETGFRGDARFARPAAGQPVPPQPLAAPADPVALAWAEGFALGTRQAEAAATEAQAAEDEARAALTLAFTRLDADMAEDLRQRLLDTVMALCDAALLPVAIDPDALAARVTRAVAMLSRAEDERVIRLHPADLPLVAPRLAAEWKITPDAALPRGSLRIETAAGGVEDGPAQWRRALAEAFHTC